MGYEDATREWNRNPALTSRLFLHTKSYDFFQSEDTLFLFGRRGTGKTSIIRMLDYEIRHDRIEYYRLSSVLKQENAYYNIAIHLRPRFSEETFTFEELVHVIKEKWTWVIYTAAMIAAAGKFEKELKSDPALKKIRVYLESQDLFFAGERHRENIEAPLWKRLSRVFSQKFAEIDDVRVQLSTAVAGVALELMNAQYDAAAEALRSFLQRKKIGCMILIDSIEVYDVFDRVQRAVMTALIDAVKEFDDGFYGAGVKVKAAFPSEVRPFFESSNAEKTDSRGYTIVWNYKDIAAFLAKRHYEHFGRPRKAGRSAKRTTPKINDLADFDDFQTARDYLYTYFPERIVTRQGIEFDTLAYMIRHTQKKPRQVIMLANIILTYAGHKGVDSKAALPPEIITGGVHARLDLLINGTIDIYNKIYKDFAYMAGRVLNGMPACFGYSDIMKKMKEINPLLQQGEPGALDKDGFLKLLINAGLVGKEIDRRRLDSHGDVVLIEVHFEYQIKDQVQFHNDTRFALHPMLYHELDCRVGEREFAYPVPVEAEELSVIERLKRRD